MKRFLPWLILFVLGLAWLWSPEAATQAEPKTQLHHARQPTSPPLEVVPSAFGNWAQRYVAESPERQRSLLTEGTRLANEHRATMQELIQTNPQAALAQAIPMVVRQSLPTGITDLLEERVNGAGFYGVLGYAEEGNAQGAGIRRWAEVGGRRYEAFVYGRRAWQRTTERMNFVGVAVAGKLAVEESPLRVLELGEQPPAGVPAVTVCPISGQTTVVPASIITAETPAVAVGDQIIYLCHGGHILALGDQLIAQEGGTGGASKPTGTIPSSSTTGPRKVLLIRAIFPDNPTDPQTEADCYTMMRSVSDYMTEVSYGKCYFLPTVTPLVMMPHTLEWYNYDNTDGAALAVLTDGRNAAKEAGYDFTAYDLHAVRYNGPGSFSGQAYVGGTGTWLKTSSVGVAAHEFGHNLGLWHANYWNTNGQSVAGAGSNAEYGHALDTMGSAAGGTHHFNAQHRSQLSWLTSSNYTTVTASGLYRIYQIDQPVLNPAYRYALNFRKDAQRTYWAEFRQKLTTLPNYMNGLQMCWGPWGDSTTDFTSYGSNAGAQLLDMTPGSPDGKNDGGLVIGKTYSDTDAGVHCTPLGKGGTTPESIDVQVNLGLFPANTAPVISSLSLSSLTPALNAAITLTVSATDGDGDALAYAWDFGDSSLSKNAASVNKAWTTAGQYWVRCEVSDMKGKLAAASMLITVGNGGGVTLNGQVVDGVGSPLVGVRVSNGLGGTGYRGSFTDTLGNYTVTNLVAGDILSAVLEKWSFVTAAPGFVGTALTSVALTTPDAAAVEGAGAANETGSYRLTRVGSTTSSLTVRAQLNGGANYGSDYTLSPAPVADLTQYYFTIPAGQAVLNITLTPMDDATIEGPEVAQLTLVPATGYVTSGATLAAITIQDLDTALPVVSLLAPDDQASETGDPATVLVRRTGATTAALNVTIATAGTATNGTDYPTLPTTITIPAGAVETTFTLTPMDDTAIEGLETVIISLSTGAAYLRDPLAQTATVQITDDDVPTVSIAVLDAAGAEALHDPAIFQVTRTGSTAAALQVEYALSGTALHGIDYASLLGTLTIPAGQVSAPITIYPLDDGIGEPAQTVVITLRSEPKYLIGTGSASVTLADNDLPMISLTVSDGDCSEDGNVGTFRIASSGTGSGNVTVNYTVTGTATAGVDYTTLTGSVSLAKAGGAATVTVSPLPDLLTEDAESVIVILTPNAAYTLALDRTASLTMADDEQPMVSVSVNGTNTVAEGGAGSFYVSRSGSTAAGLTVNFTLTGLASVGADYTNPGTSVTIPSGFVGTLVSFTSVADALAEGTEEVTLKVTSTPGSYGVRVPQASIYLTDNQSASLARTVRFTSSTSTVVETAGTVNLPVALLSAATSAISVEYAISSSTATGGGVDYDFTPGTLVFAPGETAKTIPITVIDDPFVEPAKNVTILLRNCLGAARITTSTYTLTITSEDVSPEPLVAFALASSLITEGPGAVASVTVALSSVQPGNVTVDYAVSSGTATLGSDYTGGSGTVTFPAGTTIQTISVPLVDDQIPEGAETLALTLSNALGAAISTPSTHTIYISDDDQAFVTIVPNDTDLREEGTNPGSFTITRTGNLTLDLSVALTVTGTATSGSDYVALPASISLPPGETTFTLSVTPIDDAVGDANETIIVSLLGQGTIGAPGSGNYVVSMPNTAQLTIQDNENAPPAITLISPVGSKARLPNAQVGLLLQSQVTDDGLPTGSTMSLAWSKFSGPGTVTFDDASQPTTGATFSAPGDYVLRLSAGDSLLSATQDVAVSVEPVPWQTADVGTASSRPGSFTQSNGVYSVIGAGGGTGSPTATDGHYFVYRPLSGDGEIIARITSIASATNSKRCGVMLRASTANNAAHSLASVGSTQSSYIYRLSTGVNSAGSNTTTTGAPRWVRLVRSRNAVTAYSAADTMPLNWVQLGTTQTVSFTDPVLVGLSVTSASTTTSTTAGFDNVQLITPNLAPNVTAGNDTTLFRTGSLALNGTSSDDAKPAPPAALTYAWAKLSGPGNVAFSDPVSLIPSATFSAAGSYVLRLTANDSQAITFDDLTVTVADPPVISVTAASTPAAERGLVGSTFTISRSLVDAAALAVNFTITGSATSGADYVSLGTSIAIPGNAASVMVTLTPLADALSEGPENVILTLNAHASYVLGSAFNASVIIDDQPVDGWRQQSFGLNANSPSISGNTADPDHDGLDNLVEYAFLGSPLHSDPLSLYSSAITPTTLSLTYSVNAAATDVTITPLWSDDLQTWFSTGFTLDTLSDNGTTKVLQATVPVEAAHPRRQLKAMVSP